MVFLIWNIFYIWYKYPFEKIQSCNWRSTVSVCCIRIFYYSSYLITDLVTTYGMNLNLTVCFETSGPCEINIQVLKETKLTKPTCNWTRNFVQKGLWININISDYIVFTITVNFETVFYQLYKMSSYSFFINICMCIFNFFLKIFH